MDKLFWAEGILFVVVLVLLPLYSFCVAKWGSGGDSNLKGLNLPEGSIRGMLALMSVGSFIIVLVLGHGIPEMKDHFDQVVTAFGTLDRCRHRLLLRQPRIDITGGRRWTRMTASRPWLERVELHPDVLSEQFSEDIFALDLGSLADYLIGRDLGLPDAALPRVPPVYRDADSFFRASYLTRGLKSLLEDVLGRLSGGHGNRVLKLLTPFGGGKSHTLAALLHAARSRAALDALLEASGLPYPEGVRVAVVDGQFFDATSGKRVPNRGHHHQDRVGLDRLGTRRAGRLRPHAGTG